MATVDRTENTPGGELAFDRLGEAIAADLAGRGRYPQGAAFVATDLPDVGQIVVRCARERRPIVLVYPDGEERTLIHSRSKLAFALRNWLRRRF